MDLLIWLGIFVVSLAVLITAARFFTDAAEIIGLALGMSPFVIGVIIVSIGTSLPELVSSVIAVSQQVSEIVPGNVIGSSISNLFFVLGIASLFTRAAIQLGDQYIFIDLNFLMATVFIVVLTMYDGKITVGEGIICLVAYCIYVFYLLKDGSTPIDILLDENVKAEGRKGNIRIQDVLIVTLGGIFIYLGARYTIISLEKLAEIMSISKAIVSVTLLSFGTTLPETVVSATASRQGKGEIAIGNILGSCIFNGLAISGVASFFGTLIVTPEVLRFPLPIYCVAALLFYLLTQDKNVSRWEGLIFLLMYIFFIGKIANIL
ncbi:calcium/sodium antiporter [Calothrix sp. NIES-3974]|uniref:calcium/sodium antiporter n=1 Tax=Calothrix sp. NIES-3974 TaxID=2005462 RepID=UPI000B616FD7|nr:calcium/sodium antiporter [Calothrix sp. NIES-3974]BAZ05957.1 CaCA family Na(+)/Ca(+) antiporter [Calothrix sp. NIES-3974]